VKGLALPLIAVLLVGAVLGVQVAAGGGDYVPLKPANPCVQPAVAPIPPQLDAVAEQVVLLGLDNAACRLGISRERFVLAIAETRSLSPQAAAALKAGLLAAVNRLDREGRLPKVSQLLPAALGAAHVSGLVKTLIEAIPAGVVDGTLQTGPLLRATVERLDVAQIVHQLSDPSQLGSTVRSAVLEAAKQEILNRLTP
jgi:hypothetical protein